MDDRIVSYFVGVDLGQAHDYTALSVLERLDGRRFWSEWGNNQEDALLKPAERFYDVVHLERIRHQPYPAIVDRIAALMAAIPVAGRGRDGFRASLTLVVDATGVGRPVVDLLVLAGLNPEPITITGGDTVNRDGSYWRVPKRDIVTCTKVFQQQRRLHVAPALPDAATLTKEMEGFQYKINPQTFHDSYGAWREGQHDDVLLAVALPLWFAEHGPGPFEPLDPALVHELMTFTGV
jgi:hypothetical protein